MPQLEQDSHWRIHAYCPNCRSVQFFVVKINSIGGTVRFLCERCHWVERYLYDGKIKKGIEQFDRSTNRGEYRKVANA